MKIFNKSILLLAVGLSIFQSSCKKFDDINTNPNSPATTTASLLATNLILNITTAAGQKTFMLPALTSKHVAWGELPQGEQYNNYGSSGFGGAAVLTNVQKMIDLSAAIDKDAYTGLGLFVKAYKLYYISIAVGDIPYAEALQGEQGVIKPKYDTQKDVMMQVLRDLAASSKSFSIAKNFSGDPLLNGNVATWRKVVNSFRLKVLISLSLKESDTDLKIKETFASIVQSEPILASNSDNLQLVYSDKANQLYPFNSSINKFTSYAMVSTTVIDSLKKYNDYRLFYYAAPSVYRITTDGKKADDLDAYEGVDPSAPFTDIASRYNAKKYSQLNLRYTGYAPGEPLVRIGYAEQNFIIAEAALRGWLPGGNAKNYYEEGIKASMNFVVAYTPDDVKYHSGKKITPSYITDTYLKNPNVLFSADTKRALQQIGVQKYLMYFNQYPYDAYYDYRRTGFPNLPVNPATSTNPFDKNKIPVRYTYAGEEYNYNLENLKVALDRQYGGNDRTDGVMWILK